MEKKKVSKSDFLHLFVRPDKLNITKESQNKSTNSMWSCIIVYSKLYDNKVYIHGYIVICLV